MRKCAELGIKHAWMHRPAFGAEAFPGRQASTAGITVIDGGCPLMFKPTADIGHKIMRWFARSGNVPRTVT